jgi:hypothetical protein
MEGINGVSMIKIIRILAAFCLHLLHLDFVGSNPPMDIEWVRVGK